MWTSSVIETDLVSELRVVGLRGKAPLQGILQFLDRQRGELAAEQ